MGGHLADANVSTRNAEFGSKDHSFGNRRTAVGNRIPSTRSTVTRPAQVKPTKEKDQFFFGQDPVNNLSTWGLPAWTETLLYFEFPPPRRIYTRVPTIRLLPVWYRTGTVPYGTNTSKTPCRPYGNTRFSIILTRATYWYSFRYNTVRYSTIRYGIQYSTVWYGVGPCR